MPIDVRDIRLLKVKHPKFEGHVTPNENEYQNISG